MALCKEFRNSSDSSTLEKIVVLIIYRIRNMYSVEENTTSPAMFTAILKTMQQYLIQRPGGWAIMICPHKPGATAEIECVITIRFTECGTSLNVPSKMIII